jgi:hypothetical protein
VEVTHSGKFGKDKEAWKMITAYVFISVFSVTWAHFLRNEEFGMILCVEEITRHYLTDGVPVVISLPSTSSQVPRIANNHTYSAGSEYKMADKFLKHMHKRTHSPILISRQGSETTQNIIIQKPKSYIILLWPDETDDLISTLIDLMDNILFYDNLLNPRGQFLVVVTDFGVQFPNIFATNVTEVLKNNYNIFNSFIVVPNVLRSSSIVERKSLDVYSWFPYESEQCGAVKEAPLLERYNFENDKCFSTTKSFLPSKIPSSINGCPVKISTWEIRPNAFLTSTYKNQDGGVVFEYRGIEIEYLLLLSEAMNMTIQFLPLPNQTMQLSEYFVHMFAKIFAGEADIALGNLPLNYRAASFGEPTVSYMYNSYKWYVPCAKPIRKIDNVINTFTLPAWLAIILVFVLSSLSFWGIANSPSISFTKESTAYKRISQSFNYAWSVFVGVSVAQMPRTYRLRFIFILFVCYCFAINTVFQAFFTSYLIEPRLEKQIGTIDELNASGITYLTHPSLKTLASYTNYNQHDDLKIPQKNCENYTECMLHFLEGKDVTLMVTDIWAEYFAFSAGKSKKSLCTIDENVFSMGLSMYVPIGYPLLGRINVILQRCIEAGLGGKYWSELTWNESLGKSSQSDSNNKLRGSSIYFAFTVFHLRVAFCLLAFGGALSFVVFMFEYLTKHFGQMHAV